MATSTSTVEDWLRSLGLLCYFDAFIDNGYDELTICKEIGNEDLDAIGVNNPRDRADILHSVYRLKASGASVVYFELEADQPPCPNRSVPSIEQRKKFGNVDLKSRLRDRIILDKIDLTKAPYTNLDGSLGKLDELVSYYADQFYTFHEDVRHALETIWKQKTLQHTKEEHSHMIPTMTSLHGNDALSRSPEIDVVNPVLFHHSASQPSTPNMQPKLSGKSAANKSSKKKKETPADYLNVDTSASEKLGDPKSLKKGERLSKSLSSLENCMIHSHSTPDNSPKTNKHGFLGAVKKIFGAKKDKSGRASTDSNLLACHIQMSEEDRVLLMTQVKKGEISIEEAVQKFRRFEETVRVMDRASEEEAKVDENSSPEFDKSKKERKSFKRKSITRNPSDLVASEITMGEDERKELMIRVKRGEMSIEEALGQLKSYEAEHKIVTVEEKSSVNKDKPLVRQGSKRFSFLNRPSKEPTSVFYDEDDDGSKSDQSHSSVDETGFGSKSNRRSKKKLKKSYSTKESSTSSTEERAMSVDSPLHNSFDSADSNLGIRGSKLRSSDKTPLSSNFLNQLKGAVNKPPRTLNYDYAEHETKTIAFCNDNEVEDTMKELNEAASTLRTTSPLDNLPKCAKHNRPPPQLPPGIGPSRQSTKHEDTSGVSDQRALMLANRPLPILPKEDVDEGYNTMQKQKSIVPSRTAPPLPSKGDISHRPALPPPCTHDDDVKTGLEELDEDQHPPPLPPQTEEIFNEPSLPSKSFSNTVESSNLSKRFPLVKTSNYDYSVCPPLPPRLALPTEEVFVKNENQSSLGRPKRTAPPPPPLSKANLNPTHEHSSPHIENSKSGNVKRMPRQASNKANSFLLSLGNVSPTHDYAVLEKESPVKEETKSERFITPQNVEEIDSPPIPPGRRKKEKRRSRVLSVDNDNEETQCGVPEGHWRSSENVHISNELRTSKDDINVLDEMKNPVELNKDHPTSDDKDELTHNFDKDEKSVVDDDFPTPPPRLKNKHEDIINDKDSHTNVDSVVKLDDLTTDQQVEDSETVCGNTPRRKTSDNSLEKELISVHNPHQEYPSNISNGEIVLSEKQVNKHSVTEFMQTSPKKEKTQSPEYVVSKNINIPKRKASREEPERPQLPPKPAGPKPGLRPKPVLKPKPELTSDTRNPPPLPPRKPSFLKSTRVKKNEETEKIIKPVAYRNVDVTSGSLDEQNNSQQPGMDSGFLNKPKGLIDLNKNHQLDNGTVTSLPVSSVPRPAVRRSESVYALVAKRLKVEKIVLALWPYTDQEGQWGVPVHLVSRYAAELRKPFGEVAKALEDVRINQLQDMDRSYVPYDISILSEEPEDFLSISSVDEWLINIGLPMYIDNFLSLSYNTDLIPDLTEDHLRYAGVVDPRHIKILMRSINALR